MKWNELRKIAEANGGYFGGTAQTTTSTGTPTEITLYK